MKRIRRRKARPQERGVQHTVRNIPPHVDRALRQKAQREQKSLNDVLRETLIREVEAEVASVRRFHDLDDLAGQWVEDPQFDDALRAQDQIDEGLWR